ncbi:hypothetical protein [Crocosphaera sp.]|uniref:hypothetical protein n=1 Tax=Crocosphaera sp. TaxID=2729996 RepID=UPI003F27693B
MGIEKKDNKLYFYLPKGFEKKLEEIETFDEKRKLFFLFYRIFHKFKMICLEKGYLDEKSKILKSDRDGIINNNLGSDIIENEAEENIFYSKLTSIDTILETYNEPKILSLVYRTSKSEILDYSQSYKFLHRAIFLPNNAAYVDYMDLPRKQVQFQSTDLVAMYCYLLWEVKQQLNQEIAGEIKALAEHFQHSYLSAEYSLFHEQYYSQVIDILKDTLEMIDHNTPLKDADYWDFYEAIELFLYGERKETQDGKIWGISNFHSIWESMCLTYICNHKDFSDLLHLDTQFLSNDLAQKISNVTKKIDLSNTFKINNSKVNPDAVTFSSRLKDNIQERTYYLRKNGWVDNKYSDNDYCTKFYLQNSTNSSDQINQLRIACLGQKTNQHTINELRQYYSQEDDCLMISQPLPKKYYSFWNISGKVDVEEINQMYYFNHIFLIAVLNNCFSWKTFNKNILIPLGITKEWDPNVFTESLFSDGNNQRLVRKQLRRQFQLFIELFCKIYVIDRKYLSDNYFQDELKREELKERSIRKQFVYEYLIQKQLKKNEEQYSDLKIQSEFWIPKFRLDSLSKPLKFMDDYISLWKVDFETVANEYIYGEM